MARWLGIRERFDIDVIIQELARRTEVDLSPIPEEELLEHRQHIMRHAFYQYVSGRDPQIDEHLIHRALDLWSWFWIGLEATVVFVFTGFALIATNNLQPGLTILGIALGSAAVGLPAVRNECRRYAVAQVRAILADSKRAILVRQTLCDLFRDGTRRAA